MITAGKIYDALEAFAPTRLKLSWDNVGFLAGRAGTPTDCVLVSLDITSQVIQEAKRVGAQLIVSHHPMFFALNRVTEDTPEGENLISLLENGLSAVCMHTNLDAARAGVNHALACALGFPEETLAVFGSEPEHADAGFPAGLGRIGETCAPETPRDFALRVKTALGCAGLRFLDAGIPVRRVGMVSGAGSSLLNEAKALGCDTFLTGEIKYHAFVEAKQLGMNLVEAGHFYTEDVVCGVLVRHLKAAFPTLRVLKSGVHTDCAQFL